MSVASVVCCLVEVSASGRLLIQRDPTECGEFNACDRTAPYGEDMTKYLVEATQEKMIVNKQFRH